MQMSKCLDDIVKLDKNLLKPSLLFYAYVLGRWYEETHTNYHKDYSIERNFYVMEHIQNLKKTDYA